MRLICRFLLVIICSVAAFAQQAPVGIETGDLDRSANPCTDFYQFSNGAWRAANPIPATMDRWSRRWAAGESNKDQLRVILEEAAAKHDQPKGSVDQLIGDYYAACVDESRVNQAGATPIKPMLAEIDAIKDQAGLQQMLVHFADLGVQAPFGVNAASDNHNPSQVIADVQASGLGLPDRDYYLKTEERFQQARAQYLIHVAKMFQLAGYSEADSRKAADAGDAIRDCAGQSHAGQRRPSRSAEHGPLDDLRSAAATDAALRLGPVLQGREPAARQSECAGAEVHGRG